MDVEYREVPDFPGYLVSSDGEVWTLWKSKGPGLYLGTTRKRLVGGINSRGYRHVILCDGHKNRKMWRVSRLILTVFSGPCPTGHVCAHNDGDRTNNRLSNLRWTTQRDNNEDKRKHGTWQAGEKHGRASLTDAQVIELRRRHQNGECLKALAGEYNQKYANAYLIVNKVTWRHI